MNKKRIALFTSMFIGGTLLLGTAYANASQLSGYEAYKAAIKDTSKLKNTTVDLKAEVSDNGNNLVNVTSDIKANLESKSKSTVTTLKSNSGTETINTYQQDGKNIIKSSNSDEYEVMAGKIRKDKKVNNAKKNENPEISKSFDTVIDTLVGNMKDKVSVTNNNDGTKKITANLNESEVTPLANALASMGIIRATNGTMHKDIEDIKINKDLPQLQSDIKIANVQLAANINKDDIITDQVANITVTGKDAQGKSHEIVVNLNADLSNINSTKPDTIDLTGKKVKEITPQFKHEDRE